jgi:ABC-type multidrug transport system ATPase subunit
MSTTGTYPSSAPPVLDADDVRIDSDDVAVCDGLTLRTRGERVLVLGTPRVFFEATTGLARIIRGALSVGGVPASDAVRRRIIAGAAMDPPTPPRWTVTEYVQWSARIAGVSRADAPALAAKAIAMLQLGPMATTPTSRLVPHARRATVVAAALATGASVIALDDPLGGLPDEIARSYGKVLAEALRDRRWIVFAPRMPLASPLALEADEAIIGAATGVEMQGPPAEIAAAERRFIGRIQGSLEAVLPELALRGASASANGAHLIVDLGPEMTTSELFEICDRADVGVIQLVPVSHALS